MRAYFLIIVDNRGFGHRKTVNPTLELEEIPGVKKVEGVSGLYDYLVEIDTSAKITSVAEKIMEKPWLKRLHILRPIESPCPHLKKIEGVYFCTAGQTGGPLSVSDVQVTSLCRNSRYRKCTTYKNLIYAKQNSVSDCVKDSGITEKYGLN